MVPTAVMTAGTLTETMVCTVSPSVLAARCCAQDGILHASVSRRGALLSRDSYRSEPLFYAGRAAVSW